MGRKSKMELYGLIERAIEMSAKEHLTIEQITDIFRDEGYNLSRGSVQRSLKTSKEAAEEYRKAFEESRAVIETVRDNPNTDVIETITGMLTSKFLAYVKSIDEIDFDDPNKIMDAVAKLSNSQVKIAKLRLEYQKGYDAARKDFIRALNKELEERHPDLLTQLTAIIAAMEADA